MNAGLAIKQLGENYKAAYLGGMSCGELTTLLALINSDY